MINIDTRLLPKVTEPELWLLLHLSKRINKENVCWPSNRVLCRETGWHIDKLQRIKKQLIEKKILIVIIRKHPEGGQGSNAYKINTEHIGVFIPAKDCEFLDICDQDTPTGNYEGGPLVTSNTPPYRKNQQQSINHSEVLTTELTEDLKKSSSAHQLCIDFWLKEFHPDWTFSPMHGKTLKQLILKIKTLLAGAERKNDDEEVFNFFQHMCQSLPDWFKDKDLLVINSKFNEIIEQIKQSRNGNGNSKKSESRYRN